MEPLEYVAAAAAAISLAEKLAPIIERLVKSGQIPPEAQRDIQQRYTALKNLAAFSGPEWTVSTSPATTAG